MKIVTNMLSHLQGKPLIISSWKLQMDSLNIEPQTFCGLMEIKESNSKKIEALVPLVWLKLQKKTPKDSLKSIGIWTRDLHIKHPKP